jgi:hypothetical protein
VEWNGKGILAGIFGKGKKKKKIGLDWTQLFFFFHFSNFVFGILEK